MLYPIVPFVVIGVVVRVVLWVCKLLFEAWESAPGAENANRGGSGRERLLVDEEATARWIEARDRERRQ